MLAHEDFLLVKIPPVKHFMLTEKDKASIGPNNRVDTFDHYEAEDRNEELIDVNGVKRKNFLIVAIVIVVAALFSVGIFFILSGT